MLPAQPQTITVTVDGSGAFASSPLYSQAVRVGTTVHVAGMAGIDVATGQLAGSTIQEQTRQALRTSTIDRPGGSAHQSVGR